MHIQQLDSTRPADVQRFVHFPYTLYQHCPQWVPPLRRVAQPMLDKHHPLYNDNRTAFFLATCGTETVGRIAIFENQSYNRIWSTNGAFFGFFDTTDDREVANGLFDAAFSWARQRGLDLISGPRGFLDCKGAVLVSGFEHRPAMGAGYNYPYYDALLRQAGFSRETDYLSGYLDGQQPLPARLRVVGEKVKRRRGFHVQRIENKAQFRRWMPDLVRLYRQTLPRSRPGVPAMDDEIRVFMDALLDVADTRLVKLVLKGRELAGFILAYPDVSTGLQRAKGRKWPWGWWHLRRARQQTRWINVHGFGLLPVYRGLGANILLYLELDRTIKRYGFEHVDIGLVNEGNSDLCADMETIGVRWYKRHRHYRRAL